MGVNVATRFEPIEAERVKLSRFSGAARRDRFQSHDRQEDFSAISLKLSKNEDRIWE